MQHAVVTEFSIYMADRPGELAGVLEAASAAGVHLGAICVGDTQQRGLIRLLGAPEDALRRLCEGLVDSGAGPVVEALVLAVDMAERPSAFRDVATGLAADGVNIRYAYQSPSVNGFPARCVFRVDDPERASQIVERLP